MKKRLLVTGGSGFIGKHILGGLKDRYHIAAPSHRELELSDMSVVDAYFRTHRFDAVIHTANVGGNRAEVDIPNVAAYNLRIFFNLLRNKHAYIKFIYLGSGTQYGKQQSIRGVQETDLGMRIPEDEFGLYKYIAARYIEDSAFPLLNLTLFGIFGTYEPYQFRFISNAVCRSILGMPITLSQNARFDYVWVEDFVRILDHFITAKSKYRTYNIGTGSPIDLLSIAKMVKNVTRNPHDIQVAKKGFKQEYTCDNSRLRQEIPGFRFMPMDRSIRLLHSYYTKHKSALHADSLV